MVNRMRSTKSKQGHRRGHHKVTASSTFKCEHCQEPKLPHRMCGNCGYYRGRQVVDKHSEAAKKEKKRKERAEAAEQESGQ